MAKINVEVSIKDISEFKKLVQLTSEVIKEMEGSYIHPDIIVEYKERLGTIAK